ncbi:MAG: hypothetical protein K6B70_03405, partial [Clostridia bacterium]|nr:hypothetical protein [Clostridia bacterium]
MSKINDLHQKLQDLNSQKQNFKSIENLSLLQFIKFKNLITKENKIRNKITKYVSLSSEINFWYDTVNKSWVENPKIKCNKYCKLERKASYKKNLKLYKLGFINKKPLSPLVQDISKIILPVTKLFKFIYSNVKAKIQKISIIKKICNKINYLKSTLLPQKINKLAVNTAKIGIKGYRHLQSNYRLVRKSFEAKNSFKYLRNVIKEANQQVLSSEKEKKFRESLRVNPNTYYNSLHELQNRNKIIKQNNCVQRE